MATGDSADGSGSDRTQEPTWVADVERFLSGETNIPEEVMERGVLLVADVLSATAAGTVPAANATVARETAFGDGPASILGTDRQVNAGQAALMNGAAAITQEIEEGHNTGGHVGAGIVTGGFALAEATDADGETFVEACVKAYEVCARLENAIFAMKDSMNDALPWLVRDPHSTWTTIGPAVAAAISSGFDDETVLEAFRIGANLAVVSMWDPYREGSPARNFTAGFSAQAGVNAALVAAGGLRGSRVAMREVYDPLRELKGEAFDQSFAELGSVWEVTHNYFKPFPSCRYTHPPLGALQELSADLDPDAIERIDVYSYRNAVDLGYVDYDTMTGAKFSIPYVVARYCHSGSVDFDHFTEETIEDPAVRELAERVEVHFDETHEETFPDHWSARVEVTMTDGAVETAECVDPPGDYRRFPGREVLSSKFADTLAVAFDRDTARAARDELLSIRSTDARAIGRALRSE